MNHPLVEQPDRQPCCHHCGQPMERCDQDVWFDGWRFCSFVCAEEYGDTPLYLRRHAYEMQRLEAKHDLSHRDNRT